MTLFMGRGDILWAASKTGADTATEAAEDMDTAPLIEVTAGTGTAMAFSIRLCTLDGSMTCWLSSGGGVGPMSLL